MDIVIVAKTKHETIIIDASDRNAALLELFHIFDDEEYYCDLEEPDPWDVDKPNPQKQWYAAAVAGDAKAAKKLLDYRSRHGYEYEDRWSVQEVITPRRA